MDTVTSRIEEEARIIAQNLSRLLREYSGLLDVNSGSGGLIFIANPYSWTKLNADGIQLRGLLLRDANEYINRVSALIVDQPSLPRKQAELDGKTIKAVIEQTQLTYHDSIDGALKEAREAIDGMLQAVRDLPDTYEGVALFLPDTNALLFNTDLEHWAFEEPRPFTLLLVPAVLGELDELKINHRNPEVREKAESLIRRIKEYGRRGSLLDGVSIVKGAISIRSVAREPRVQDTLPWLDPNNHDDRILASLFEVMRVHPRCDVQLVTRDINLQNKAAFARVPFREPPEPGRPGTGD